MRKGTKRKTTHKGESPSKPAEDQKNGRSESPSKPDKENHLEEKSRNGKPERSKKAAAQGRPKRAKVSTPEPSLSSRRSVNLIFVVGFELFICLFVAVKSLAFSANAEGEMRTYGSRFFQLAQRLYHPFQEDELEQSTVVQLLFPIDPKPVFCEFDWELDELEEFTDKLIEEEELPADQKEAFKDFVKEKVREAKKANREAREARKKALAEMSEETKAAFENMRFYKFYPVSTPDTPDVSSVKIKVIRPLLASSRIAVALHQQILWEG
ncbi:UNVERIFIED_CONTAM: protein HEAT INTOLERANT 4 [Sesamum angustifolium]|uniref:Protein HEAT INTOLERANT 4 n=1 Tax=Sesamum angustifolium TaxID=2727405 RepID=A0AAW2RQC9_9LAMI